MASRPAIRKASRICSTRPGCLAAFLKAMLANSNLNNCGATKEDLESCFAAILIYNGSMSREERGAERRRGEHLQEPHNAGSRPQARLFNIRLDGSGALHHIIVRRIARRAIVRNDDDRHDFLKTCYGLRYFSIQPSANSRKNRPSFHLSCSPSIQFAKLSRQDLLNHHRFPSCVWPTTRFSLSPRQFLPEL